MSAASGNYPSIFLQFEKGLKQIDEYIEIMTFSESPRNQDYNFCDYGSNVGTFD